ncbi:hypothetical protein K505DRAFT_371085 [Melanomma pulvis-pyrius CBS 109.77]|uniref:Rhodopsin domain-containing protein n=1 Tax=Melanomma pulvis-pyrius CBS 109.77 TaxID=1314802 RepID=A0A6A6XU32_9PLEO|nr:hypothetical protein K505DRAFT_371085 [Melanomma pulvis-pyrius CBS 109.77]
MSYAVYHSRAGIIAGTMALQLISSACVGLRFYTRFWRRQSILISDWLVLAAFACGTGLSVMEIYGVAVNAFAVPIHTTSYVSQGVSERLMTVQHMEYAFVLIGVLSIGLIKLSVSLLYWHIFAKVKFRRFLAIWIGILVMWTLCFVLAELLECGAHPLKVFGTRQEVDKYCPHIHDIGYALIGSDIATDFITLLIPLPPVLGMRLPTTQKILVTATFFIGVLAVGASTAKGYIYISAVLALAKEDAIILVTAYSMWNLVEIHVGIIAACGMTLRPILSRMFPCDNLFSLLRSSFRSSQNTRDAETFEDLPSFVRTVSESAGQRVNPESGKARVKGEK